MNFMADSMPEKLVRLLYILGYDGDNVYEYDLSSTAFTEAPAIDGSVDGSLIVSLRNDTFVNKHVMNF